MKLLIASDIHGSALYCEKLFDTAEKEGFDRILLLGDLLYHGPRNDLPEGYDPKKVIDILNGYKDKIFCVRGNCEAEVDQMVLKFPVMADYALIPTDKNIIFATHGHIYNENTPPSLQDGDILLNGHTHIPKCTRYGNFVYLNPGSVSIPKEDSPHSFMTFDGNKFLWKDIKDGRVYSEYKL